MLFFLKKYLFSEKRNICRNIGVAMCTCVLVKFVKIKYILLYGKLLLSLRKLINFITMFKIGQKVVCVEVDEFNLLKKDEIYTVRDINNRGNVKVVEVKSESYRSGYFVSYKFRPIDNSWAEELLHKIIEEELVLA